jgi:hypothetical protein
VAYNEIPGDLLIEPVTILRDQDVFGQQDEPGDSGVDSPDPQSLNAAPTTSQENAA